MNLSQQWDTGWEIGMYVLVIVTAGALAASVGGLIVALVTRADAGLGTMLVGACAALVAGIILVIVAWPFSGQYHRYQPLGGTVAKVGSRLIASGTSGGGSTQKFVLTFKGGLSLGCNDTRCSNVDVGDQVTLMCERAYQLNAPSPGWDCNWGQDVKPDGSLVP